VLSALHGRYATRCPTCRPEGVAETLTEEFPRVAADFVRGVRATAELGRWSVQAQVLVGWKATAAIYSDPALVEELNRPFDGDFGPVPAPGGAWGLPAKRGDRVAAPARPGGREARFATSEAAKGGEELCRVARANTREACVVLTERPTHPENSARQHRLRGQLAGRQIGGRTHEQWQYEVTAGGRICYCPDGDRRIVWVVAAGPAHPKATEKITGARARSS
jgi:hypothetical protein